MIVKRQVFIIALIFFMTTAGVLPVGGQFLNENTFKIGRLLTLIENFYVDTVDIDRITEKAIVELLRSLDPHSAYIPADEVREMNEPLMGNFDGIGIQFNLLDDTILVTAPIPGGPSEKAGLLPGDRIVAIEDETVAGVSITTTGVRDRLLGAKGTTVRVGVYRRGVRGITEYVITRDKISVNSVDAAYMLDKESGYVKINRFSMTTGEEFFQAVEELSKEGLKNIVIDLRGNTGGVMGPAIEIADAFFPEEKLIVYLEGTGTPKQEFNSTATTVLKDARVVLLTDEGSASASEILAGALQDWDRGLVIGRRTFGKGLVQSGFTLTDGSMVRLTVARYYTPSGRSIQSPYADGYDQYIENYLTRYTSGEVFSSSTIDLPDSLQANTLVNNRVVYSGGGIMPDYFVGADTTAYSEYYRNVVRLGIITRFTLSYVDNNRIDLNNRYSAFSDFRDRFEFTEEDKALFVNMAKEAGVEYNEEQFKISEVELFTIMKGLVARDLWEMNEYFRIVNENDPVILHTLEVINDASRYNSLLGFKR